MKYFFVFLISFSASLTGNSTATNYFVIWNVGQGQFTSSISPLTCTHFDMGGEFFPWHRILSQCRHKKNQAFLSHWDWDHIGALKKVGKKFFLNSFCIALKPLGKSSAYKMKLINSFPTCDSSIKKSRFQVWKPAKINADTNSSSQVIVEKKILVPGDSPASQEKIWSQVPWIQQSRILILGHHGSKTSTSQELLKRLPNLKMSVSSARWHRYKHPHASVEARLHKAKIPLLRTEDWGNIWIEQSMSDFTKP